MNKAKAHIRYRNKENKIVPGVTTITGVLDKPALVGWANRMGLQGIDTKKYVDILADAGTLAHRMIECHLKGIEVDTYEYSKANIDMAKNAFLKYLDWEKMHEMSLIFSEKALVSDIYNYGGTIDSYFQFEGNKKVLIDFKTSKAIYTEHGTQVIAYEMLLKEHNYPVDECYILRIGRTEDEGFEFKRITKEELHKERFLNCLNIYRLNKELRK